MKQYFFLSFLAVTKQQPHASVHLVIVWTRPLYPTL